MPPHFRNAFRACRAFNHPRNWRRRLNIFFLESPLETSIWIKATFVGCFLLSHPTAFRDTPAWVELEHLGSWFPGGATTFFGILSLTAGLLHAIGMCARITYIRQVACVCSASLWWTVAYNLFAEDSADPAAMVFCVGALYSVYIFFLVSLGYTTMRVTAGERELVEEDREHKRNI